jgi:heterodisulfide reductase subunit A
MVVLSTGFKMTEDVRELSTKMGLELNPSGFAVSNEFSPVETSKPGIYVCGMAESPKDIPETMVQASAAACMAGEDVAGEEKSADSELPPERDVTDEAPRIGVFLCDCGENIGGVLDVNEIAEYAKALPSVVLSEAKGHGCSRQSIADIQQSIVDNNLNRVVIGGCSPRTHETKFQEVIRKAGLNKYLVEIANIRDQATWVHPHLPQKATEKAKDLIRMAVGAVAKARPLKDHSLPINKDVLVVGGGVTGMTTALQLGNQGYKVYLAELSNALGGNAKKVHTTLTGGEVQPFVNGLIDQVTAHDNIQVITRAIIVDHSGMPGMFKTGMQVGPQMFYRTIQHGVTILATGALANRPNMYLLDESEAVSTQLEMDNLLAVNPDAAKDWENVVMIQCVGSRVPENPNCSRICCQAAIKNALHIKKLNPNARIFVIYRDMRTYGFQEEYYMEARKQGVIFARYAIDNLPQVEAAGKQVEVTFTDPILGRPVTVVADRLCLSTGMVADTDSTEDLARIFKLPRTQDGFFQEDHVKLRPVDLPVPGFYVAGTAHSPKTIRESVTQAQAVASRAQLMLAKDAINLGAAVARVDSNKCAACLICVRACPFDIPFINSDGYSEIDPAKCHGCGLCASECPAKAIQLAQFEDDQIVAKLEQLFERMVA